MIQKINKNPPVNSQLAGFYLFFLEVELRITGSVLLQKNKKKHKKTLLHIVCRGLLFILKKTLTVSLDF